MRIIEPSVKFNGVPMERQRLYDLIETAARVCYQSEPLTDDQPGDFIRRHKNHEAILEHGIISLEFTCDRGVTHELVRHRLFSFCQESTRYCNYSKGKFGGEITVINPSYLDEGSEAHDLWKEACKSCERAYLSMLEIGMSAQQARAVLPNSTKAVIVISGNPREWRHFFNLRKFGRAGTPHPQMKQVADMAWDLVYPLYPAIFEDLLTDK